MSTIKKTVLIAAPPAEVFALIADIEGMPRFSASIIEVRRVSENNYFWRAKLKGIPLEWNAVIDKKEEPEYLSWHSISGLDNRGEYRLEAQQDGTTRVTLLMEYHLHPQIIEKALHIIIDELIEDIYAEILSKIKKELER
ncbi:hypothetical protein MNBD_DELTA01-655 [hydrothermal vent metagenome]|uniref:Coenzyme Q-binding protein COQ10 START domain-containing protein n=1 Tax=hydrothermal vent metagenome TaxID=652676 RepID=A0A3B0QZ48_9ZZZZ